MLPPQNALIIDYNFIYLSLPHLSYWWLLAQWLFHTGRCFCRLAPKSATTRDFDIAMLAGVSRGASIGGQQCFAAPAATYPANAELRGWVITSRGWDCRILNYSRGRYISRAHYASHFTPYLGTSIRGQWMPLYWYAKNGDSPCRSPPALAEITPPSRKKTFEKSRTSCLRYVVHEIFV